MNNEQLITDTSIERGVNESLKDLMMEWDEEIAEIVPHTLKGDFIKNGEIDNTEVRKIINEKLKIGKENKIIPSGPIAGTREPHLYPVLQKKLLDHFLYHYDLTIPMTEQDKLNQDIAEEQLHGVPALDHEDIDDKLYGIALLEDKNSGKKFLHHFFACTYKQRNEELELDIATRPSLVFGTDIGQSDQLLINQIRN